jgi:hypothetical protein
MQWEKNLVSKDERTHSQELYRLSHTVDRRKVVLQNTSERRGQNRASYVTDESKVIGQAYDVRRWYCQESTGNNMQNDIVKGRKNTHPQLQ